MLFCRFISIHPFIFHRLHGVSLKIICVLLFPHLRHHSSSASPLPFILSYYSSSSLYSSHFSSTSTTNPHPQHISISSSFLLLLLVFSMRHLHRILIASSRICKSASFYLPSSDHSNHVRPPNKKFSLIQMHVFFRTSASVYMRM